ncbi:hypothetical protein [Leptonema illini]|uniref:Uncharacterized protein n=1 Tax=Leptonema illini DSM 21528 TaxID=929563 RepID=H2CA64_9LEPT|nr:hypothetical protein [Leptonema illini]EHQ06222.1 hypothetical protein Lepil_1535 [Leptonema illini DSM 21528]
MDYYSSEDRAADAHRINRSELPSAKKAAYLNERVIRAQMRRGRNAVDLSLIKWRIIRRAYRYISERPVPAKYYADLYPLLGYRSCALCLQGFDRYSEAYGSIDDGSTRCQFCSLAAIDRCTRPGSTFVQIEGLLHSPAYVYTVPESKLKDANERLGGLIDTMIKNLMSLRS